MGCASGEAGPVGNRPDPAPRHAFVVRLWWEAAGAEAGGEWRGTVLHVPTSAHRSFRGLDALPGAIRHLIAELEPA
jgi:hypothetical protein